ncbi:MAG: endonuclease/exonuclease/phosphatase family protein [Deltaproteobacteria bacterium]|jgi:endonuclease/exonuclease/phosphatase family metal-dependent hydrolase|nr:endonuclease/exonuclease/phosphatase family protein [Deltaproteobacteria bacterium]MBW2536712.1 endonuclease/exonuclease/phosphatase family protein [Deltaproteobacteria bacterium]
MEARPFRQPPCRAALAAGALAWALGGAVHGCSEESPPTEPTTTTTSDTGGAGAGGGGPGGDAQTAGVTLMTWNLETFPLTAQTGSYVRSTLEALRPDLVAVQDIAEAEQLIGFAEDLDGYAGLVNDDPGAFLRVGLLYRTDRVVLSETETLFSNDWYGFPRPPLKVRAEVTDSQDRMFDFLLLVVHLKAQLDEESQDRRRSACATLEDWIRSQLDLGAERDIIVAGDFNDELTDPPTWNVFEPFLAAPDDYRFLTLALEQAGEHTYIPFDSFIDHVLVTSDALNEYGATGSTEVLPLEQSSPTYEATVSDHRPVLVRFALDG